MKLHRSLAALVHLVAAGFCVTADAGAGGAWAGPKDLTPENLIRSVADFTFELSAQPQDAEVFLQRRRGDCDDFASLASRLLTDSGYQTKLVVVMMEQQTHVVCYVKEARGFLDFNHRADARPIIESDGSLEDIARKVARDFRQRWQTASEFRYENKLPIYGEIAFPSAAVSPSEVTAVIPPARRECHGTNDAVAYRTAPTAPITSDKIAPSRYSGLPWRNGR
jgi:hypothetical protein